MEDKMTCPQEQHDSCTCVAEEEVKVEDLFVDHGGEG
jgi:hypothetical protein